MPPRPLRPCAHGDGCRSLVVRGSCAKHRRKRWNHNEPSRHKRGYGSEHVALRRQVLKEEPVCRYCRLRASTTMDHIVPKSQGGTSDRSNLAGCCTDCQQTKASHEGNAKRRAVR